MNKHWCSGLLLSLALSLGAQAAEVRLVTGDHYAPYTGRSLVGSGMLSQVVQAAFARSGMTSTLFWQPWNRGYLMTLLGKYDATFPYVRAPLREQAFLYSAPLYLAEQRLFSRAEDAFELEDLPGMSGSRLCHPLGWHLPEMIQTRVDQGALVRHSPSGLSECARLLLLGRDDFFLADLRSGQLALRSAGAPRQRFHVSAEVLGRQTMHLIVLRSHPSAAELIERFDQGLSSLHVDGAYQRLIDDFLAVEGLEGKPRSEDDR